MTQLQSDAGRSVRDAGPAEAGEARDVGPDEAGETRDVSLDGGDAIDRQDAGPFDALDWPSDACVASCVGSWELLTRERPIEVSYPWSLLAADFSPAGIYDPVGHRILLPRGPRGFVWAFPFEGPGSNQWVLVAAQGDPPPSVLSAVSDPLRRRIIVAAGELTDLDQATGFVPLRYSFWALDLGPAP